MVVVVVAVAAAVVVLVDELVERQSRSYARRWFDSVVRPLESSVAAVGVVVGPFVPGFVSRMFVGLLSLVAVVAAVVVGLVTPFRLVLASI